MSQVLKTDKLAFEILQNESAVNLLLIAKNSEAKYLLVF